MTEPAPGFPTTFGELLRHLRRRAQLTQQELGIALGYSAAMVTRLESGQRLPDLALVKTAFVEALALEHEPELVMRLIQLAEQARGDRRVASSSPPVPNALRATNLPVQLTRFIGRERELAQVVSLIGDDRLVTLTGSGGVGKTRLAIEVGASLVGDGAARVSGGRPQRIGADGRPQGAERAPTTPPFSDGVWFVDLAALADPALIPQTVATVLAAPKQPGQSPLEAATALLTTKHLLLILDNCEHLAQACAELAEALLRACPHVRILATSREPLRAASEVVWRVPSMATPDPEDSPPISQVVDYEAIELFVQAAAAADPGFSLAPNNVNAIVQICWRLDGIPLAIEMAAAQVATLPVGDIMAGLDDRFSILTSGRRTALPRQQTLRATLDWSFQLLDEQERCLLARLSVFAGGWTIDAAKAVCADQPEVGNQTYSPVGRSDVRRLTPEAGNPARVVPSSSDLSLPISDLLPLLLRLVHKSLVVRMTYDGGARYRFLETVHQYAKERLTERGDAQQVRNRHLAYYLALAEEVTDLGGRHVDAWVARVDPEYDNLRAAFTWARACAVEDQGESMLHVAAALRPYWWHDRGSTGEALAWLDEALSHGAQAPAAARAWALLAKATMLANLYNATSQDADLMRTAFELFEQTDDRVGLAWTLEGMASGGTWDGDERLEAQGKRALRLFREIGSQAGMGRVLRTLGSYALRRGDHKQAHRYYLEAFQVAQQIVDMRVMVTCLDLLTLLDREEAYDACEREVLRLRRAGEPVHLAMMLGVQGDILLSLNEYARASAVLTESLALWQQLGHQYFSMHAEFGATLLLGIAARALGNVDQAIEHTNHALRLAEKTGSQYSAMIVRFNLVSAVLARVPFDADQADGLLHDLLRELHNTFKDVKLSEWALIFILCAELARQRGDLQQAARLLGVAKADACKVDDFPRILPLGITAWWHLSTRLSGYESTYAAVRTQMDAVAFDTLWAEGRAMPLDQAVEYALARMPPSDVRLL